MTIPQLIITLHPETGTLVAELPGFMATRRQVPIRDLESIERMLRSQLENRAELGSDGAPTVAQVKHWEDHGTWASSRCRFCLAEGRSAKSPEERKEIRAKAKTVERRSDGIEIRRLPAGQSFRHKTLDTKRAPEDLDL